MCRAVPSKVVRVEVDVAWVDLNGQEIPVSLLGVGKVKVGEYVYHHAGLAIERLDSDLAAAILAVLDELDAIAKMADD